MHNNSLIELANDYGGWDEKPELDFRKQYDTKHHADKGNHPRLQEEQRRPGWSPRFHFWAPSPLLTSPSLHTAEQSLKTQQRLHFL